MKKILIIISTLILILSFSEVKAETYTSMDFTWSNNGQALPTYSGWPNGYNGYTFDTNYKSGTLIFYATQNQEYVIIPSNTSKISIQSIIDIPIEQIAYDSDGGVSAISSNLMDIQLVTNGTWSTCNFTKNVSNNNINNNYEIICPIQKNVSSIQAIVIYYHFENIDNLAGYIGLGRRVTFEISDTQNIINQQQQTNDLLNETTQYNTETNTNTIGANETIQAGAMEDQLLQENEFNGSILEGMSINSSASGFIWQIIERLRSMNIAIVSLMTMALGLGVIKLVLNR